jgi:ADP-ribosylglycohydrolase
VVRSLILNGTIHSGISQGDLIGGPKAMAAILATSLDDNKAFDRGDVLRRYLTWWQSDGFDTGPVADSVFELISNGENPEFAVEAVDQRFEGLTAGCNPAHRNIVLAEADFLSFGELTAACFSEAALTHRHILAGEVAAVASRLARALLEGETWEKAVDLSIGDVEWSVETTKAAQTWMDPPEDRGGFSPAVLAAAMHFVGTSENSDEVFEKSCQFSGGSNYVPVLACALAAAIWGDHKNL